MSYAYLFKYIVIGDTGASRRSGKKSEAARANADARHTHGRLNRLTDNPILILSVTQASVNRVSCSSLPINGFNTCMISP